MKPRFRQLILAVIFLLPIGIAYAAIVPCDGIVVECNSCKLVTLAQNILNFLITFTVAVSAVLFAWAGMLMVTAGGDTGKISKGRSIFTNVVIGLVIVLAAWLLIDTVMKIFTGGKIGPWNEILCGEYAIAEVPWTGSQANESRGTAAPITGPIAASANVEAYRSQVCTSEVSASQCASLLAIMTQESGGNPNAVSPANAYGLMQVTVGAARSLDRTLEGLSDAEVRQKLLNDPAYNISIAKQYYARAEATYGANNYDLIYAAYNGGAGANRASVNCPGSLRWQCEWDNNAHTVPNTGYAETRNYVSRVNQLRTLYGG